MSFLKHDFANWTRMSRNYKQLGLVQNSSLCERFT